MIPILAHTRHPDADIWSDGLMISLICSATLVVAFSRVDQEESRLKEWLRLVVPPCLFCVFLIAVGELICMSGTYRSFLLNKSPLDAIRLSELLASYAFLGACAIVSLDARRSKLRFVSSVAFAELAIFAAIAIAEFVSLLRWESFIYM